MADNIVEIVLEGKDDTGAAYTSAAAKEKAFADLTARNSQQFQRQWDANRRAVLRGHDALLQAARAEMEIDREAQKLSKIERDMSGGNRGGFLTRLLYGNEFAGGGNGVGGLSGLVSNIPGGWLAAIPAAIPVIGSLLAELTALASGFAAAGAGAAAFYGLSHNAFTQLQSDVGKLQSGQVAVQLAANLEKLYPSAAHLKSLETAKEKLKALTMSMGQDAGPAAAAMASLGNEWHNLQNAFAPTSFKVLGDVFTVVKDALPGILPLAQAFAGAITPLLGQLDRFVKSSGFKDWLKQFTALVGPATGAIGHGIGDIVTNFGKLFTLMSAKDVVNGINFAFRILSGTIRGFVWTISHIMSAWDQFAKIVVQGWHDIRQWTLDAWHAIDQVFHNLAHAWDNVKHAWDNAIHFLKQLWDRAARDANTWYHDILRLFSNAGSWLLNAGRQIIDGLIRGIQSALGGLWHLISSIGSSISSVFGSILHIFSPSKVFEEHGRNIVRGLVNGINGEAPTALAAMRNLGTGLSLGGPGGGGLRGAPLQIQLTMAGGAGGSGLNALFWQWLKNEVRVNGGGGVNSVQRALGQNF